MAIERLRVAEEFWRESGYSHLQRYLFARDLVSGRVLDVACGVGYGSYMLAHRAAFVQGIDVADEAISTARAQHQRPNISYHCGTLETLPASALFDAAVSLETIEHVTDPRGFLREISRRLRPGATLIASAPNVLQHTRANPPVPNHFHLHEPTYAEFHEWLSAEFKVHEEWEQTRVVAPNYDHLDAVTQRTSELARLKSVRLMARAEIALRRLFGKSLPPENRPPRHSDALVAETAIVPLLPARRNVVHTFVFVAHKRA
jgi:SAM-dependent methyltransferase